MLYNSILLRSLFLLFTPFIHTANQASSQEQAIYDFTRHTNDHSATSSADQRQASTRTNVLSTVRLFRRLRAQLGQKDLNRRHPSGELAFQRTRPGHRRQLQHKLLGTPATSHQSRLGDPRRRQRQRTYVHRPPIPLHRNLRRATHGFQLLLRTLHGLNLLDLLHLDSSRHHSHPCPY